MKIPSWEKCELVHMGAYVLLALAALSMLAYRLMS